MQKTSRILVVLALLIVVCGIGLVIEFNSSSYHVNADTGTPITGYLWSEGGDCGGVTPCNTPETAGGIGWIWLNCSDDPVHGCTGPAGNWGLSVDSSGNVIGYAWSENIGWIKFGGLSNFPSGAGTVSQNAQIDGNGNLIGWARACSGTAAHGDCSTMSDNSNAGSWDGWIALSGSGYGPAQQSTGYFTGYTWGGSVNVGWIDWQYASTSYNLCASTAGYSCSADNTIIYYTDSNCNVSTYASCTFPKQCMPGSNQCQIPLPTGAISVKPQLVTYGGSTNVTWSAQHVDPSTCSVSTTTPAASYGPWLGAAKSPTNGVTATNIYSQMTFTLTCTALNGSTFTASAIVTIAPVVHER